MRALVNGCKNSTAAAQDGISGQALTVMGDARVQSIGTESKPETSGMAIRDVHITKFLFLKKHDNHS